MKKSLLKISICSFLIISMFSTGCKNKNQQKNTSNEEAPVTKQIIKLEDKTEKLCDLAEKYGFKFGTCISYDTNQSNNYIKMVSNDFNSITATNEFKAYSLADQNSSIKNKKLTMNYQAADAIAQKAIELGVGIRGHVLVWDAYMPDWYFREGFTNNGKFVSSETMKNRLKDYITEVVTHFETNFPGLVYCWDVVNEAVADTKDEAFEDSEYYLRKSRSGTENLFAKIIGTDYVKLSFKYARDVVNKVNPDIKLYYNDYNTFLPDKDKHICTLINYLNETEWLCDGVGMQGYIGGYGTQSGCMNVNDIKLIRDAILKYASLGLEVQLTEVAVRNYRNDDSYLQQHGDFYGKLFNMLKTINTPESSPFKAITIWGIKDNPSAQKGSYDYMLNGPYCGLFEEYYAIKPAYVAVYNSLKN